MKTEEEFKQFYNEYIEPEIASLEVKRNEASKRKKTFSLIAIPIGVILIIIALSIFPIFSFMVGILFFIFFTMILHSLTKDFRMEFKKVLITKVISFFSSELQYFANESITLTEFMESKLFYGGNDRFNGEDLIEGKIYFKDNTGNKGEGISLRMSELHAEERRTDSKGRTHYSTIFKGVFMILEFNKTFSSDTYVFNDSGIFNKVGGRSGTKQVKLEDPIFEKEFEVYSNNQIEARYILSPDFMNKLLALKEKTNGKMRIAFKNNKMYLSIGTNSNILEPNYSKSLNDFNSVLDYYKELEYYFELIKSLNLDQKIYL